MQKGVLVVVDLQAPAPWAVFYAIQLAVRLKFPLALLAVSDQEAPRPSLAGSLSAGDLEEAQRRWLDQVLRQCQGEGVSLEIFLSSGPFFEEVARFLDSQPAFRFLVVGVPRGQAEAEQQTRPSALKDLHRQFSGEILLVREQGKITNLAPSEPRPQGRKW